MPEDKDWHRSAELGQLIGRVNELARRCYDHFEHEESLHTAMGQLQATNDKIEATLGVLTEQTQILNTQVAVVQEQHKARLAASEEIVKRIGELEKQNVRDAVFRYIGTALFAAFAAFLGWALTTLYQTHWPDLLIWANKQMHDR